jgi:hypothetical protein
MDQTISISNSVKKVMSEFEKIYNINESEMKLDLIKLIKLKGKKLIKITHLYELIWKNKLYRELLFNEIVKLPLYIPNINNEYYLNSKKINNYLISFSLDIDHESKELISNILYLFVYYLNVNFTKPQMLNIMEYYILKLMNIDNFIRTTLFLQEIIIRAILIEITDQGYSKFTHENFKDFTNKINNKTLKEIFNISFNTYKLILTNYL